MRNQLRLLRECMAREKIDVYIITMEDNHQSENVDNYFREIAEVSGFTGSAGTLVVSSKDAGLWTDGRYFVQAEKQLEGTGVRLMRLGEENVPSIETFIYNNIPVGGKLGFNGKCVSYAGIKSIVDFLKEKKISVSYDKDLPDLFWKERPAKNCRPCFILEEKYTGRSLKDKISAVRAEMEKLKADVHIISTLDDISWILNLRGSDVDCNPVFSAFLMIDKGNVVLYTDEGHITAEVAAYLEINSVSVKDEDMIYADIKELSNRNILLEEAKSNFYIVSSIPSDAKIIDRITPSSMMKCYKNDVEMANLRRVHVKDGVAVTKFMYWFKQNVGRKHLTEWDAALKIEELRKEQKDFIEDSFTTIAAYGANAAMCHYAPSAEVYDEIEPRGLFLLDSGGHYYDGTTDITRTWSCGPVTSEESLHYTYTVMANLRLSDVVFLEGSTGMSIDYAAREIFWKHRLNFNHGTGHGVGFALNVHERPVGIRFKVVPERMDSCILKEGAFVSNEPGIYIAESHGVRIENLMMCVNDEKNEFGQFMRFDTYTLCPIETDILRTDIMSERDIELLNAYNKKVCETLLPYMNEEEGNWLRDTCNAIKKK